MCQISSDLDTIESIRFTDGIYKRFIRCHQSINFIENINTLNSFKYCVLFICLKMPICFEGCLSEFEYDRMKARLINQQDHIVSKIIKSSL